MESTRTRSPRTRPPRRSASATPRPRARSAGGSWWLRVRWDRVGRISLLAVLGLVIFLYAGPARSYISTLQEAGRQRANVASLQAQHDRLAHQVKALRDPRTLEREARSLGMVRPDERSYVILGLPGEHSGER